MLLSKQWIKADIEITTKYIPLIVKSLLTFVSQLNIHNKKGNNYNNHCSYIRKNIICHSLKRNILLVLRCRSLFKYPEGDMV